MPRVWLYLGLLGLALANMCCGRQGLGAVSDTAPASSAIDPNQYYAVLLSNNSVYFGKLEGATSDFPVLHDVYYVQSGVDKDTKAVNNILVKRGKEWHGPDRMIINQKAIVFIEPVGPGSKVAQLIAESKK